jgi:hypothetical protein
MVNITNNNANFSHWDTQFGNGTRNLRQARNIFNATIQRYAKSDAADLILPISEKTETISMIFNLASNQKLKIPEVNSTEYQPKVESKLTRVESKANSASSRKSSSKSLQNGSPSRSISEARNIQNAIIQRYTKAEVANPLPPTETQATIPPSPLSKNRSWSQKLMSLKVNSTEPKYRQKKLSNPTKEETKSSTQWKIKLPGVEKKVLLDQTEEKFDLNELITRNFILSLF